MDTNEISILAKTHTEAIFVHNLTKAEIVMLVALIEARVQQKLSGANAPILTPIQPEVTTKPLGAKIADKGSPCVCVMCAKHIYTVNKDIHENEPVDSFVSAFTPMPGYPFITKKLKISNINNNITTNCPSCNAEFSLYLAGKQI